MKIIDHSPDQTPPDDDPILSRRELLVSALVAAISGGCRSEVDSVRKAKQPVSDSLWQKRPVVNNLNRAEIPSMLPELIAKFGRVCHQPENYDPPKPNLYLLANRHFETDKDSEVPTPEESAKTYQTQEKNLQILHILHSLGASRQFLEGVPAGFEMRHDTKHDILQENPVSAFPEYLKTGKIKRSYIAFEGVYGDDLKSLGTEEIKPAMSLHRGFVKADRTYFPMAMQEIMILIAIRLGIDSNQPGIAISNEIANRLYRMSEDEKNKIVRDIVIPNANYQRFLDAASAWYYHRIQGRNLNMAASINEKGQQEKSDSVCVVGSEHIGHLKKLFPDWNVFVLATDGVEDSTISSFHTDFTLEDYRKCIQDQDLYRFGLGPKPKFDYLIRGERRRSGLKKQAIDFYDTISYC